MPRKRTGNILPEGDHFVARVLLDDGKYGRIKLPPGLSEAKAKERAAFYAENIDKALEKIEAQKAQKTNVAPIPKGETFTQYLERWLSDRDKRGYAKVHADRLMFSKHVCPHIGDKPIAAIEKEDLEKIVQAFDEKTARKVWSWATGMRAWLHLRKLFSDSCKSKNIALRVRKDNPSNDVAGPDRGDEKAKAFLYPDEFVKLVTCASIPIAVRRLYAIAIYLYSRASEIRMLRWTDVDLVHGTIKISRAYDHERRIVKSTKAGRVRTFAIEPNLLPLLEIMFAERKDDGEFMTATVFYHMAKRFRGHLQRAGITRSDLFVSDAQHMAIRFHDTRATGITWMAMRGDPATTIMERVGHKDFATTQIYLRQADALRGRVGEPFPALPACLLVPNADQSTDSILSSDLSTILAQRAKLSILKGFGDDMSRPLKGH
jgi:integrase